jgi:hypothetical protein
MVDEYFTENERKRTMLPSVTSVPTGCNPEAQHPSRLRRCTCATLISHLIEASLPNWKSQESPTQHLQQVSVPIIKPVVTT